MTVAICTYRRPSSLHQSLVEIRRLDYDPLEILVVDNAPSDPGTREVVAAMARTDRRVRYVTEPAVGLSRARNRALARARYDVVAFTDDDTLVDSGWVAALAAGFAYDPRTVCVTGLIAASGLETASEQYFDARYTRSSGFRPLSYDLSSRTEALYPYNAGIFGMGANFALRRETALRLGGFDPLLGVGSQGRGGEDLDMFLRIVLAGGQICYMPSALVWHQDRVDTVALSEQIYSYGHGLGAYLAKHIGDPHLRKALLSHGLRHAGQLALKMRRASQISHVGANGVGLAINEARGVAVGAMRHWLGKLRPGRPPGSS